MTARLREFASNAGTATSAEGANQTRRSYRATSNALIDRARERHWWTHTKFARALRSNRLLGPVGLTETLLL